MEHIEGIVSQTEEAEVAEERSKDDETQKTIRVGAKKENFKNDDAR